MRRRVVAIVRACRIAGHALDTKHPAIRETLRGIGRKHGTPARRSAALTITDMRKLVRSCGTTLAGARDRALFLIGFAGALRRSELVGLNVADVTWTSGGLELLITRSKTDAEGAGARIGISRGKAAEMCPVTALQAWLTEAGITDGPVFRKVNRGGAVELATKLPCYPPWTSCDRSVCPGCRARTLSAGRCDGAGCPQRDRALRARHRRKRRDGSTLLRTGKRHPLASRRFAACEAHGRCCNSSRRAPARMRPCISRWCINR